MLFSRSSVSPRDQDSSLFPTGRRLVDIGHLLKAITTHRHLPLFSCSAADLKFVRESRTGLASTIVLQCAMCKTFLNLSTDDPDRTGMDVNMAMVTGMVTTGGGHSQLEELSAVLNMPAMSSNLFRKTQDKLFGAVQRCTWSSLKQAGEEEARLAKEAGEIDPSGTPCITVIADGAWSKRSYKTNYNASSGVACIVGQRTGKILFVGVRNKYCCVCDRAQNKSMPTPQHKCFRNWTGSSTGMETDIIVDGFKRSLEMHGLRYTTLVGDGDSSVHNRLLEECPYGPTTVVHKIECSNHLLRNYCSRIRSVSLKRFSESKTFVPVLVRQEIGKKIRKLCAAVQYAAKHWRTLGGMSADCVELKRDIQNGPHHVFGDHSKCASYYCKGRKENEKNWIPEMKACGIYADLELCLQRLIRNSNSLFLNMTNNAAEAYNSVVAKFVGGK